jgi:CRP-like cAMP-binding protein/GNAT superfamily N-acetyltransferase
MSIDIYEAQDALTRDRVFRFRYEVHVSELGKSGPGIDHQKRIMTDDCDRHATILYAEDESGSIVGTATTWFGKTAPFPPRLQQIFATSELEKVIEVEKLSVTGRLMVDPNFRGRTLTSLLVMRLYELALHHGTEIDFCMCSLPLLRLYQHLGYRSYQSNIRPDGLNLRVPLALCVRDRQHLSKIRSPFMRALNQVFPSITTANSDSLPPAAMLDQIYGGFQSDQLESNKDLRMLWAELADGITRTEQSRPSLFDGLSEADRKALFSRATIHDFKKGERVKLAMERRKGLGVILRGRLGVGIPISDSHHWVEILESGDVFGELQRPPKGGRATDLVSMETCALAFLPDDIVERLERNNPILAMRLARNLLSVLRQRVDDMHRLAAENIQEYRDSDFNVESKAVAI